MNNTSDHTGVGTPDAAAAACGNLAGTWAVDGTCGADVCIVTQTGCATSLSCSNGAASYTGSISGDAFTYTGTTGGGVPASCTGTLAGNALTATCTVQTATCTVSGARQ